MGEVGNRKQGEYCQVNQSSARPLRQSSRDKSKKHSQTTWEVSLSQLPAHCDIYEYI